MDYKELKEFKGKKYKPNKYYTPTPRLCVSDDEKIEILAFFETHKEIKKGQLCKKLGVPLGAINTLKGKRPFLKHIHIQKLLNFIREWETS